MRVHGEGRLIERLRVTPQTHRDTLIPLRRRIIYWESQGMDGMIVVPGT
jgi:hypothetical protein